MIKLRIIKGCVLSLFFFLFFQCSSAEDPITVESPDEYDFVFKDAQLLFGKPIKNEYVNKVGNEYSIDKVILGEKLFNDQRLSIDNSVSCSSCHNLENKGGTDNLSVSVGVKDQKGTRNAPSVINAALHFSQFWEGRSPDVEDQAGKPILNPIEMGMENKEMVEEKISGIEEYQRLFKKAFPNDSDPITFENITKSIASFERTLIRPSRFDKFLAGDINALTNLEKKGIHLFKYLTCTSCHSGNLLGGNQFRDFGRTANYWNYTGSKPDENGVYDTGRFAITGDEADKYVFKVPSLRNVEKTFPYFHDGSVFSLRDAIKIMGKAQLGEDLNKEEIDALEAFLKSLTSES